MPSCCGYFCSFGYHQPVSHFYPNHEGHFWSCRGHFCQYADFHSSFIVVFKNYTAGWIKVDSEDLGFSLLGAGDNVFPSEHSLGHLWLGTIRKQCRRPLKFTSFWKEDTPVCYTPKSQPSVLLSIPSFVSLLKSNPNNDYPVLKILLWVYFLAENRPIFPTGISLCPPILSYQISTKSVLFVCETT